MTEMQKNAMQKILDGHNLLLLGQSGTGKSYVVREISRKLSDRGVSVSKTGTTGMAALEIEGITLHRWSGYGDGRLSGEELAMKILNDEHFQVNKNNIMETNCLIIDEISMMSRKMFEDIEFACRKIKNPNRYFGGIQVIGVGDFFQLPPVPDRYTQDTGVFCFKSSLFHLVFPHVIMLSDVMRQQQQDLVRAVHEISKGKCSMETNQLLNRLSRKLPPGETPVRLCGRRFDCEIYNSLKLMDLDAILHTYKSTSEGPSKVLDKIVVPHVICLKVGCPVLLVKNLSNTLVNGLRGIVRECNIDNVVVEFVVVGRKQLCKIKQETFTVYDNAEKKNVATRYQLPLILAYGITIHKAQGLTLTRVEVDASNIFAPGQLGVALGRATDKKGLRVIGFRPEKLIAMSEEVLNFYTYVSADFTETLECCKYDVTFIEDLLNEQDLVFERVNSSSEDSDFSESEIYDIDHFFQSGSITSSVQPKVSVENETVISAEMDMPFDFLQIQDLLNITPYTPEQTRITERLKAMFVNSQFHSYVKKLYECILGIFNTKCSDISFKKAQSKTWTGFYTEVYKFSTSDTYKQTLTDFLQANPNSDDYSAIGKVFDKLCQIILEKNTSHLTQQNQSSNEDQYSLSEAGDAKIRYLGGRCVAKTKYHTMKSAKVNLYNSQKTDAVNKAFLKVKCLDFVTMTSTESNNSTYKPTLIETERKQNISRGLTEITDPCFEFFVHLNKVRMSHQTETKLHLHGSDVLNATKTAVWNDESILSKWKQVFHSFVSNENEASGDILPDIIKDLFLEVSGRFLRIADNQFRKDCLRNMGRKKVESIRKQVIQQTFTTEPEHVSVKAGSSGRKRTKKATSDVAELDSVSAFESCSKETKKPAPVKRSRKKRKKNSTYCKSCDREYNDQEEWIQCDTCNH